MSFRNHFEVIDKKTKKTVYSVQVLGNHEHIEDIEDFVIKHFGKDCVDEGGQYHKPYSDEDCGVRDLKIDSAEMLEEYFSICYKQDLANRKKFVKEPKKLPEKYDPMELANLFYYVEYGYQVPIIIHTLEALNIIDIRFSRKSGDFKSVLKVDFNRYEILISGF